MIIGQYIPGDSIVHRLDPRLKMGVVFFYVLVVFAAESIIGFSIIAGFALMATILTRIPFTYILKGLKPVWFLIIITFIFHVLLTRQGDEWFSIFGFSIYEQAVVRAIEISARFALLILVTTLLTLTTTPIAITDGIESILRPLKKVKIPVHEFALMMSISLRFIPTLTQELTKIQKAQASRGLDFRTGKLKDRIRAIIPLIIPLFISAFKRAEELAMAMEARGYRGDEGRTKFRSLILKRRDYMAGLLFVIIMVIFLWLKIR